MIVKHVLGSFLEDLGYQIEEPDPDDSVLLMHGDRIVESFSPTKVTVEELRNTAYADAEKQLVQNISKGRV